ncbi:hypothetical protein [Nocardia sp. NPDC057668]|uniref:phage shock envelope stress response protein PspM n=1 Tax=Nocardia sp. NPDC057668 TaxID=3346202 RepID=UPI00366ADF10
MGRSRADKDPATSPARFPRLTRTKKAPAPIPGFPTLLEANSPAAQAPARESDSPAPGSAHVSADGASAPAPDQAHVPAPAHPTEPLTHPGATPTRRYPAGFDPENPSTASDYAHPPERPAARAARPPHAPPGADTADRQRRPGPEATHGPAPVTGRRGDPAARERRSRDRNASAGQAPADRGSVPAGGPPQGGTYRTPPAPAYPSAAAGYSEPQVSFGDVRPRFGEGPGAGDAARAWPPAADPGRDAPPAGARYGLDAGAAVGGKRGRRERATQAARDFLAPTGVEPEELAQRLPDTLRGVGEQALVAVRKWADPRERELRRRRRSRRRSFRLGTASGLTTAGTVGLVLISAPAWAVIVVGGGAVALVTGAAVTTRRYLQLRKEPLPQAAFVPRKLPPARSAARASIARLVRAERALHGLIGQIAKSQRLLADDLTDTVDTAASGAAALHALAADVVAMENAAGALGPRNSPLGEHITAVSVRLDGGVLEFEGMVAAAARVLAVPESAPLADDLGWATLHLRDAADRLDGWAQALTELADGRFRAGP